MTVQKGGWDYFDESFGSASDGSAIGLIAVKDSVVTLTQGLLKSDGSAKVIPTTANPKEAHDVNAPNGAANADAAELTAVLAADVVQRSWTEADVDGVTVDCSGGTGFTGVYVTLSSTDIGTSTAATRLTGANDNADRLRVFCPAGQKTLIPFPDLQFIYMVAMDVDASEQNHVRLYPV